MARTTEDLEQLGNSSYVNAVLWLGARLADGLAHAHARGIIHRDLKPANVLLTDEGQPMLLDFNLSVDVKLDSPAGAARVGGTLPYMAPEQLEAFRDGPARTDARCDIYSLGLILYELLANRHPFPTPPGRMHEKLPALIEQRRGPAPRLRPFNRAVPPAAEAIVRKCLAPDPAERYQDARELKEDIERHLHDLPLRHAPNPSLRERLRKWARRHPRLTSTTAALAVAAALLVALGAAFWFRGERLAAYEAAEKLRAFRADKSEVEIRLACRLPGSDVFREGVPQALELLGRYRVLEDPAWAETEPVLLLPEPDRRELRRDVGDLLFLLARAEAVRAEASAGPARAEGLRKALRLNSLAELAYAGADRPAAVAVQRRGLRKALGEPVAAGEPEPPPGTAPSPRDLFLLASDLAALGRYQEALPKAEQATEKQPQFFPAWFVLGCSYYTLAKYEKAEHAFSTCVALNPGSMRAHFNRGLARLKLRDARRARDDFDRVVELDPDVSEAYFNRALARRRLADLRGAAEDLTAALERGIDPVRGRLLRARVYAELGEDALAEEDLRHGLSLEPGDVAGWLARGFGRIRKEPAKALEDFEQALQLDPTSLPALQNKAAVLAECLGRPEESAEVLTRLLQLYPEYPHARASRGVVLARMGRRAEAHRDAEDALAVDNSAATRYQVAGIYALTSRQVPDDRARAFHLLASALREGYGLGLIHRDRDLDPVRDTDEFRRIVAAARTLNIGGTEKCDAATAEK